MIYLSIDQRAAYLWGTLLYIEFYDVCRDRWNTAKSAIRDHPMGPHKWSYMIGGLSLEVQMYRNLESCYCNNGLSLEVGLSSQ